MILCHSHERPYLTRFRQTAVRRRDALSSRRSFAGTSRRARRAASPWRTRARRARARCLRDASLDARRATTTTTDGAGDRRACETDDVERRFASDTGSIGRRSRTRGARRTTRIGGRARRRGGGGTATREGGETWRYAECADEYEYRGAWLAPRRQSGGSTPIADEAFEEKVRAMKAVSKRLREAKMETRDFEPGGESYEDFLGAHVTRHVTLARKLGQWRTNFLIRFEREPEYADMPSAVRDLELEWIALGFKIRAIEKI